jgi:hypothetical protein
LAEFTLEPPGGGHPPGPGGSHPKKGMKINKPMIYIGGAVIIILFLVIRGRSGGSAQDTGVAETSVNYPSNSVDVAGQLQNNSDIMMGQVQQQLTQFQTGLAADQLTQQKAYADKLKEISDKMGGMSGAIDLLNSHPAPANNTPPPAPAPAPPKVVHVSIPTYTGGDLTTKESRFLKQINDVADPSTAQLQTLGSIAGKSKVIFDTAKLSEKEQRFIKQTNEIKAKGGTLSKAQLQTVGSITNKAGTIK